MPPTFNPRYSWWGVEMVAVVPLAGPEARQSGQSRGCSGLSMNNVGSTPAVRAGRRGSDRGDGGAMLIALEGIDGCGKSTQARLLAEELRGRGHVVCLLREPGDTTAGRELRRIFVEGRDVDPEEEVRLFLEDRKIDVRDNIRPALARGETVIMDRYYLSSVVYQGALGIDPEEIRAANEAFAPAPDLTIVLDVPPGTGRRRIHAARGVANTFEGQEYLTEVRRRYLRECRRSEDVVCIDATGSVEAVAAAVREAVRERLE